MIKVVIIEDEAPARKKINSFLDRIQDATTVVKELETVDDTVDFFQSKPEVDLIISDIELRDGNVFEAYQQLSITTPIIFATAYDQFWMNAFESNGIEYLLKPYSFVRFQKAWNKYAMLVKQPPSSSESIIQQLEAFYKNKEEEKPEYKDYIPVKANTSIYFLKVDEVLFIQADYGVIFAYDVNNKRHTLNQTSLKEVQELLNPSDFFKINRSEVVNRKYIEQIDRYTKNSVAIKIKNHSLKTSQSSTGAFNQWLGI
ncbi:response regulator transcription factor [Prolixibacteraceae bacterium JC049]|nr:response regulator transcription factor [Prolixibacteraceae bacterium JC049]